MAVILGNIFYWISYPLEPGSSCGGGGGAISGPLI